MTTSRACPCRRPHRARTGGSPETRKAPGRVFTGLSLLLLLSGSVLAASGPSKPAFQPKNFAYVLQGDQFAPSKERAVQQLAECGRDLIVIDEAYTGGTGGAWSAKEIETIRAGKPGRRVVAYLSIGEAEDYRPYWKKEWDANKDGKPDKGAPAFLCEENPEWHGNYKVKYWHKDWQAIMLACVDGIVRQGFDGLYLDIVDGFEYFEYDAKKKDYIEDRRNSETGKTYRQDMIDWVLRIAAYARAKSPHNFLIIPQNGSQLLRDKHFLDAIDGVGMEDLFTNGNKPANKGDTASRLEDIQAARAAGKPVLDIEYAVKPEIRRLAEEGAKKNGLVLLVTDRNLKTLGTPGEP